MTKRQSPGGHSEPGKDSSAAFGQETLTGLGHGGPAGPETDGSAGPDQDRSGGPGGGDGDSEPPEPMYASVEGWVLGQFVPMFRRPLGGEFRWCRQWWRHAEAITRLTALWHAWEVLRLEPGTGIATWLRDHLDHQLPVLMGRGGPFAHCSEDEHFEPHEAATDLAPPGWWDIDPADQADGSFFGDLAGFGPGDEDGEDGLPWS